MHIGDVLKYFGDFSPPREVKPRELALHAAPGKAVVITGPRRAGKTYLLLRQMSATGGFYIDFEHPLFADFTPRDVDVVLEAYFRLNPKGPLYAYLDEVQAVEGWEKAVRYLLDRGFYVYATGSTSRLMTGDVAREMRGRGLTYVLLPLSFREFLWFKGLRAEERDLWTPARHEAARLQEEYLKWGGFPEVALLEDKYRVLKEYLVAVVARDVEERHGVRNKSALDVVVKYVLENYARHFTYNSLYKLLKTRGVTKRTVMNYVKYLEEAFFLFQVKKLAPSPREAEAAPRKIYLIDTGYALFGRKDPGRDLENAVYLHLLRTKHYRQPDAEIYYAAGRDWEIDFVVVKEGAPVAAAQATAELHYENWKREVEVAAKAARRLGLRKITVVTLHQEDRAKHNGVEVEVVPYWRWALTYTY